MLYLNINVCLRKIYSDILVSHMITYEYDIHIIYRIYAYFSYRTITYIYIENTFEANYVPPLSTQGTPLKRIERDVCEQFGFNGSGWFFRGDVVDNIIRTRSHNWNLHILLGLYNI